MKPLSALQRRAALRLAFVTFATAVAGPALAQSYPDHPIKLIVPWPAGGVTDASARLLAEHLGQRLKQTIVVDNRPGANGRIGAEAAANAAADGYTLFIASAETHAINPHVFASVRYDPVKDFAAIAPYAINPFTVTARSDIKASNIKEVVQLAKASPGKITSASWGIGSTSQIILEMVKTQAGIDILHVPFQGEAPAVTSLMGSQVDMMVMPAARADTLRKDGKVKVLAVTTANRFNLIGDVPTLAEQGYKVDVANWFGVVAPAKTPRDVVQKLADEINALMAGKEFPESLRKLGVDVHPKMSPEQYQKFIQSEVSRWGTVINAANIRLE